MNIIALPPLILTFVVSFAGIFVFAKNTKHPVNRMFMFFSLLTALYSFADYHYLSTSELDIAVFWLKVQMIWPLIYVVQFHFLIVFVKFPLTFPKSWKIILYTAGILVSCYFMFLLNIGIKRSGQMWIRNTQDFDLTAQLIQMVFSLPIISVTLIFGIWHIIKSKGRKKTQILLILSGMMLTTIYSIVKEISPSLSNILFVPISYVSFVNWLLFVYAIWRYRLFNITPEYASQNIISTMKEGLLLIDENGYVLDTNEAFLKMFGRPKMESKGVSLEKLFNQVTMSELQFKDEFPESEYRNKRIVHINREGKKLILNVSASFIRNYSGKITGFVLTFSDFTEFEKAKEKLKKQQQQMGNMAHQAGMAEVASNIMHNIGNMLNSIHVSSEQIFSLLNRSKIKELSALNRLLKENKNAFAAFLTDDPKGKLIPGYFREVTKNLESERKELQKEGERLIQKINMIGESVELQQGDSEPGDFYESVEITALIDEVLKIMQGSLIKNSVEISVKNNIPGSQTVEVSRNKMFNILLNIVKNAYESVKERDTNNRRIEITIFSPGHGQIQIDTADNGAGIAPENLDKIFTFGFTTKEQGSGFGLHYCATAIQEMNGSVSVKSDGLNNGAVFSITLPVKQPR